MQWESQTMQWHEMQDPGDDRGEHGGHAGHEQMFRRRFWIDLVLTIPILLFSPML